MELTHEFTVPTSVEDTWAAFQDLAEVGKCFPGAQVTGVEGDTFTGTAKIKLGPIALVYGGTGEITARDAEARTMTLTAKGKDKRGNGTAGADVVLSMSEVDGSTRVEVVTDLNVTGKPAQFGRGMMQDVSDKLLGQFVDCLQLRLGAGDGEGEETAGEQMRDVGGTPGAPMDSPADPEVADKAPKAVDAGLSPGPADPAQIGDVTDAADARGAGDGSSRRVLKPMPTGHPTDEALDLGSTVLPVLVKSYGPQLAGVVVVLLVLRWLLGRRRR